MDIMGSVKREKIERKILISLAFLVLFFFMVFVFIKTDVTGKITGFAIQEQEKEEKFFYYTPSFGSLDLEMPRVFKPNEKLSGNLKIKVKEGECLIPTDVRLKIGKIEKTLKLKNYINASNFRTRESMIALNGIEFKNQKCYELPLTSIVYPKVFFNLELSMAKLPLGMTLREVIKAMKESIGSPEFKATYDEETGTYTYESDEGTITIPGQTSESTGTETESTGTETHLECRDERCVLVEGPGENQCLSDEDCGAEPTTAPIVPEGEDITTIIPIEEGGPGGGLGPNVGVRPGSGLGGVIQNQGTIIKMTIPGSCRYGRPFYYFTYPLETKSLSFKIIPIGKVKPENFKIEKQRYYAIVRTNYKEKIAEELNYKEVVLPIEDFNLMLPEGYHDLEISLIYKKIKVGEIKTKVFVGYGLPNVKIEISNTNFSCNEWSLCEPKFNFYGFKEEIYNKEVRGRKERICHDSNNFVKRNLIENKFCDIKKSISVEKRGNLLEIYDTATGKLEAKMEIPSYKEILERKGLNIELNP